MLADSRRYQPLLVPGLQPLLHLTIGMASHATMHAIPHVMLQCLTPHARQHVLQVVSWWHDRTLPEAHATASKPAVLIILGTQPNARFPCCCTGYMQLTEEQVDEWADDANVMLSEENMGGTGVRASAEALLQSLVMCGSGSSGPAALAAGLHQRLAEAEALRSQQPAVRVRHRHIRSQCCCNWRYAAQSMLCANP